MQPPAQLHSCSDSTLHRPTSAPSGPQVTVSASGLLGFHSWLPYDRNINNYFSFSKDATIGNPK